MMGGKGGRRWEGEMEQKIKRGEMREVVREEPRESLSYKLVKNVARNKCCFYLT